MVACGSRFTIAVLASALATHAAAAAASDRVLVVYNANVTESLDVANHYADQRGIPPANLCAISPSDTVRIPYAEYAGSIRPAIRSCLNAVGRHNILYVVLTYMTPYYIHSTPTSLPYAVDQYVADIWDQYAAQPFDSAPKSVHRYYAANQSQENIYWPFVAFAAWRVQESSQLIYSVWRLDGASAALANGLVDKALAAEAAGGPSGRACFDLYLGNPEHAADSAYSSGDWDLHRAAAFTASAGFPLLEDTNASEFGTPPSGRCDDAALYSGWYSLNHYNDAFTWNTGAIGFHLDSASASEPRGGPNWSANALIKGITVTSGSIAEPYLEGLARPAGVYRNLLEGATVGEAFLRNTRWLKWVILNFGDPLYTPFAGGRAPFSPAVPLLTLALDPLELAGGFRESTATLTLPSPAAGDGLNVSLSTNRPDLLTFPGSITIPAGSTTASFQIQSASVTSSAAPILTAASPRAKVSHALFLDPLLGQISVSPNAVTAGRPAIGQVLLNGLAPPDGITVSLTSTHPAVEVPPSVFVPAGQTSASFDIQTSAMDASIDVTITASFAGTSTDAILTINP